MPKSNIEDIEQIIKAYGKDVLKICHYYLRNKQDAEDAFQEVFIKVIKKHFTFNGDSEFKTWLTRVAINTCKDFLKRRSRNSINVDVNFFDLKEGQDQDIAIYDEHDELFQVIVSLPLDYKDVILLKYYTGYTSKEIAKIFKISEPAVNSRLNRAKIYLKKILTEKGWQEYEYLD